MPYAIVVARRISCARGRLRAGGAWLTRSSSDRGLPVLEALTYALVMGASGSCGRGEGLRVRRGRRCYAFPALIFDFGKVVAYFDYLRFFDRLARGSGVPGKRCVRSFSSMDSRRCTLGLKRAILTSDAFAGSVTAGLGLSLPLEEFVRDWEDIFWLNEPVSRLIARLKSRGYTLILGSNTNVLHASLLPAAVRRDARPVRCAWFCRTKWAA